MKETRPWFKFYPSDFIEGTAKLDLEEIGAYILMLSKQWKDGSIPSDMEDFAESLRRPAAKFTRFMDNTASTIRDNDVKGRSTARGRLTHKFVQVDNTLLNERLEEERQVATRQSDMSREHGKKGGRPKTQRVTDPKPYIETDIEKRQRREDIDTSKSASPIGIELEELFSKHIKTFTKRKRNKDKDALVFDAMIRLDERTPKEIKSIIAWLGGDSKQGVFWKPNILSPTRLRKTKDGVQYFDKLLTDKEAEMPTGKNQNFNSNNQENWSEAFQRIDALTVRNLLSLETANMLRKEMHGGLKTPTEVLRQLKSRG